MKDAVTIVAVAVGVYVLVTLGRKLLTQPGPARAYYATTGTGGFRAAGVGDPAGLDFWA